MRYPKLRELKEAIKALIKGPYTTKFPKEPSVPFPRFRGRPRYYKDDCVGCGACAEVCPARTIEVTEDTRQNARKLVLRLDSCLFCGNCQDNCITGKGIRLTNEYDTATFDREAAVETVEKELLVCEECGCVIGAKDHIRFLAEKLGALAYTNPTLILSNQKQLEVVETEIGHKSAGGSRPAMFRLLCPQCRRQAMLMDEWGNSF